MAKNTPYDKPHIDALLFDNDRKLAIARVYAFMEFMRSNAIDQETRGMTDEQTHDWEQQEKELIDRYQSRRMAILALGAQV